MLRLSFRTRFEAAHRLTLSASLPCQTPHGHTWWVSFQIEARQGADSLGNHGMLAEFSSLKAGFKQFIDQTCDHSFFYNHQDPIIPDLRRHIPEFRGLEFPEDPTTEWIALLFYEKFATLLRAKDQRIDDWHLSITIDETPTNQVTYTRAAGEPSPQRIAKVLEAYPTAWWNSALTDYRRLR